MKGQFMMISAIIAGLITTSAASTIATAASTEFEVKDSSPRLYEIKDEAEEFDFSKRSERRAFENMVDSYGGYNAEYSWDGSCFNTTITGPSAEYKYTCLDGS